MPQDAVSKLLCDGPVFLETRSKGFESIERDSFGRVLGRVKVYRFDDETMIDVGEWLKLRGHVR